MLVIVPLGSVASSQAAAGKVSYNFEVRPILAAKCFSCHGSDPQNRKGKLRLDTFADASAKVIKPGNSSESELIKRVLNLDPEEVMPPPEKHQELTVAQKDLLGRWIAEGAVYEPHWAFVTPADTPAQSIDDIVAAKLQTKGFKAAPAAEKNEWLRRVTLALNGVVPTLQELDAFLADTSPKARELVVDRLLASPFYGERMAAVWLDAARYADTFGRHEDQDNLMWPWRDWVIKAFNENMPYDQFLTWQMAGDLLPQASQEQRIATGFHRLGMMTNEAGSNPEENRWMQIFDRVQVTSTVVLGLTLECAQCHNHKYDPLSMKDYYQMAAFFDKGDEFGLFARFCNGTPPPCTYVYQPGQDAEHAKLKQAITTAEADLKQVREAAGSRFREWCQHSAPPLRGGSLCPQKDPKGTGQRLSSVMPNPELSMSFDAVDENLNDFVISRSPDLRTGSAAGVATMKGVSGRACEFPETGAGCGFPTELCYYRKYSPFTFSFWLTLAETPQRGVIFHRTRAGVDAAHRGYDLMFIDGKLTATLAHFFPGDAIRVQALDKIDFPSWRHVALTYDGSSRAEGVRLYVDGKPLATRVIRDSLQRDIDYRFEWGDRDAVQVSDGSDAAPILMLGQRTNETGLQSAGIDELRAYDRALSPVEITFLSGKPVPDSDEPWLDWYVREIDPEGVKAYAALTQSRKAETDYNVDLKDIMVMEDTPGLERKTPMLTRGDFKTPAESVEPGTPAVLNPMPEGSPGNRLGLARWMVDEKNPLTARVQANRLWSTLFGRGLVATPQDFGVQGQVPAIPELLDYLARRLIHQHWDMKALCREIALSQTYGQSSLLADRTQPDPDPENLFLARGPRFRLSAEQLRDSVLVASGLLNPKVGGPSVKPYQPAGLWEDGATQHVYVQDKGPDLYRRSLYSFWRRTCPPPTMTVFDAPSREFCLVKRTPTMTPLQVLASWNDTGYLEAARVIAEHLVQQEPSASGDSQRVITAFRSLTGKLPTAGQTSALVSLMAAARKEFTASPQDAEKLIASAGESARMPLLSAPEVAATLLMVRSLFNAEPFMASY
ncbi:DUF1553 domain-containing protein [soil metagenome]